MPSEIRYARSGDVSIAYLVHGDGRWAEVVERHHAMVRRHLDRFRGSEMDTAGGGFFATFDGPIRAICCAQSTVKDLVAGSGIVLDDRGEHELKGVPGRWRLYAVS